MTTLFLVHYFMITQEKEKEQKILSRASQIFAVKDYHEVTMEEIAESCEVGKGTLYRYYRSKDDLYTKILVKGLEALYSYLVHEVNKEKKFPQKLEKLIYCTLYFFSQNKPFVKVFFKEEVQIQEEADHPTLPVLTEINQFLIKILEEGAESGFLKAFPIPFLAASLTGMVKAIFLAELNGIEKESVFLQAKAVSKLFMAGAFQESTDKNDF